MSRGLGAAQRHLLGGLYAAASQGIPRWDLVPAGEAARVGARLRRAAEYDSGRLGDPGGFNEPAFHVVAHLRLGESRDPVMRHILSRTGTSYRPWYIALVEHTTEKDRARLRSWRAMYRRAARSLSERGLIESVYCTVFENDLYGVSVDPRWPPRTTMDVLLAQITAAGRQYVEERRTEIVAEDDTTNGLRGALRAAGFLDIAPPKPPPRRPRPVRRRPQSRQGQAARSRSSRGKTPAAKPAEPPKTRPMTRDEVAAQLESEGHDPRRVGTVLRAWHREEQRDALTRLAVNGVPLRERLFAPDDIAELRRLLTNE